MNRLLRFSLLLSFLLSTTISTAQNIGINGTGAAPDASAMLDVSALDKGMLVPRVTLDDKTTAAPITGPADGLLIYNQTGAEAEGFWYWEAGAGEWVAVGGNAQDDDWDRDAANGYMFPSNLGDEIGIGTNTPTTVPNTQIELNNSGFASMSFVSGGVEGIFTSSSSSNRVSIGSYSNHDVYLWAGPEQKMRLEGSGDVLVNPTQNTTEFQVMGDGETHLLFGETGDDQVGIGTSFPNHDLEIRDADGDGTAEIQIGSAELIQDRGANHLGTNSDFEIDRDLILNDEVYDNTGVSGNDGDIFTSTGNGVEWVSNRCLDKKNIQDGFEGAMGNWYNVSGDDDDWERNSGATGSTNTGPSGANEGSEYIYCETSSSSGGDQYFVETDGFLCKNSTISFDYHMYFNGATDGTLQLQISTDGGASWTTEWSRTGGQGTTWNSASVNLGGYANSQVNIRFRFTTGTTGTSYQYDAALDDITITNISEVGANSSASAPDNDFWYYETNNERFMRNKGGEQDCVLVGTNGAGPNFSYEFAVENGSATGTQIGIGSVEYLTDESSETTINNRFSPAEDNTYDLGNTTRAWETVHYYTLNNVSDRRSKEEIAPLTYGVKELMQLKPVRYRYKRDSIGNTKIPEDKKKYDLGLIAQDVAPLIGEAVNTHHWKVPDESNPNTYEYVEAERLGIDYTDLIPVLIKATQEQQGAIEAEGSKNEKLKKKIQRLESENQDLKDRLNRIESKLEIKE